MGMLLAIEVRGHLDEVRLGAIPFQERADPAFQSIYALISFRIRGIFNNLTLLSKFFFVI